MYPTSAVSQVQARLSPEDSDGSDALRDANLETPYPFQETSGGASGSFLYANGNRRLGR